MPTHEYSWDLKRHTRACPRRDSQGEPAQARDCFAGTVASLINGKCYVDFESLLLRLGQNVNAIIAIQHHSIFGQIDTKRTSAIIAQLDFPAGPKFAFGYFLLLRTLDLVACRPVLPLAYWLPTLGFGVEIDPDLFA